MYKIAKGSGLDRALKLLQDRAFRVASVLALGGRNKTERIVKARSAMNFARLLVTRLRRMFGLVGNLLWQDFCNDCSRVLPVISMTGASLQALHAISTN